MVLQEETLFTTLIQMVIVQYLSVVVIQSLDQDPILPLMATQHASRGAVATVESSLVFPIILEKKLFKSVYVQSGLKIIIVVHVLLCKRMGSGKQHMA